jgi:hypothetical protein
MSDQIAIVEKEISPLKEGDEKKIKKDQKWLDDLQKKSWEPEVIISSIALAFIFIFPSHIFEFAAGIIQDFGLSFVGAYCVLLYVSFAINIFKIFLIVHLLFRFAWTGLLGLSYAYPQGVVDEKLQKSLQGYKYLQPKDMIINLEKICSITFAFPLMMGIILILFSLYFSLILIVSILIDLSYFRIEWIFFSTIILYVIFIKIKLFKIQEILSKTIYSSIYAVYQSNLGKWKMGAYISLIMLFAVPFIKNDLQSFSLYAHQ